MKKNINKEDMDEILKITFKEVENEIGYSKEQMLEELKEINKKEKESLKKSYNKILSTNIFGILIILFINLLVSFVCQLTLYNKIIVISCIIINGIVGGRSLFKIILHYRVCIKIDNFLKKVEDN
jgi:hypothetical protein